MLFLNFPPEVIIIIFDYLDTLSIKNMYDCCRKTRHLLSTSKVVRYLRLSKNSLATTKTLKTQFFKDMASHLLGLDMSGVSDLTKWLMMPSLRELNKLKTLDVTHTEITMIDFIEMHAACPTIINIAIDFKFVKTDLYDRKTYEMTQDKVVLFQDIFQNMKNVHFVGTTNDLLYTTVPQHILHKANLNLLKLTALSKTNTAVVYPVSYCSKLKFNKMYIFFMDYLMSQGPFSSMSIYRHILKNIETIKISFDTLKNKTVLYSTPHFKSFLTEEPFASSSYTDYDVDSDICGNTAVLIFNKDTVSFDDSFMTKMRDRLLEYVEFSLHPDNTQVPASQKWFYTQPQFRKERILNAGFEHILDYDASFRDKSEANIKIIYTKQNNIPVTLCDISQCLTKLTFLSISGQASFSGNFFKILFSRCIQLLTLNIENPRDAICTLLISRSIPLSRSLKNLRLVDQNFDYRSLFFYLSQCETLENVYIVDAASADISMAEPPRFFKNCPNLYSLSIHTHVTDNALKKIAFIFDNSKAILHKSNIAVNLRRNVSMDYDIFLDPFRIFPIHESTFNM